jgi:hypothetical protein
MMRLILGVSFHFACHIGRLLAVVRYTDFSPLGAILFALVNTPSLLVFAFQTWPSIFPGDSIRPLAWPSSQLFAPFA